ncbi:tRNA-splicing endonuclease subunit Sen54-like isoform X2 [Clinocottus analis]|uniref:tRNA-splicing endonuclease subunit Sen54-like isoform X2 n=1 Tax=Clinocottus analis TaxID=304258 RepID=UPI0035C1D172
MADQNKKDAEPKFYNEILTPSELFAVRSCSRKILVRGQKDFFLDDSDKQRWQLEKSLNEHWSLISEERVKKLGNLVKATWIPSERTVELQSPAGSLQVFHHQLPLSIQDGYEPRPVTWGGNGAPRNRASSGERTPGTAGGSAGRGQEAFVAILDTQHPG